MPYAKNCNLRYQVLDHCLQSKLGSTLNQLREACNAKLSVAGYNRISPNSKNTILSDLGFLIDYYNAPVVRCRIGREIFYKYSDPKFSIFKSTLPEEDLIKIQQTLDMLGNFEGRVNFEWVEDIKIRLNALIKGGEDNKLAISYDSNLRYDMNYEKLVTNLYDAIISKKALEMSYQSFKSNCPKTFIIHPYHLRQYNNRWFLISATEGFNGLSNYALDRIVSMNPSSLKYRPNTEFDCEDYFFDIVGVSKPYNELVQKVEFWVSKDMYKYIATKPLHRTQDTISQDENGGVLSIEVIPNYELEQLILSYGESIKVLSPKSFRDKVEDRIKMSLENYKTVQFD